MEGERVILTTDILMATTVEASQMSSYTLYQSHLNMVTYTWSKVQGFQCFPSPRWMWLPTGYATLMTTAVLLTVILSGQWFSFFFVD